MSKLKTCCVLLLVSIFVPAIAFAAQASATDESLALMYRDKKFSLPKPYCGAALQFDEAGKQQGGEIGAWTLCQNILVKDIHQQGNVVQITGQRIYLSYDLGKRQFRELKIKTSKHSTAYKDLLNGQQVAIQISLPAAQNAATVQAAIDNVLRPADFSGAQTDSDLWRDFFSKPKQSGKVDTALRNDNKVVRVGNGVSPPVPVLEPDPEYASEAHDANYTGTGIYTIIVDTEGHARNVRVVRPLGVGLDEKAAETIRKWQFKPALKNGQPVAVIVSVEVSFHLY